jgi:hypothetical protein
MVRVSTAAPLAAFHRTDLPAIGSISNPDLTGNLAFMGGIT